MGIWQIASKDLRILARDRRALAVLVIFPLAFITILGTSTSRLIGWQAGNQRLSLVVVNLDGSPISNSLLERLERDAALKVQRAATKADIGTLDEADQRRGILLIGPAFQRNIGQLTWHDIANLDQGMLADGLPTLDLRLVIEPAHDQTTQVLSELVFANALRTITPVVAETVQRRFKDLTPTEITRKTPTLAALPQTATSPAESAAPPDNDVYERLVPAYTVMFTFFLVNVMSRSFISERELGTLRRLRLAPLKPAALLAGKTIPFLIVSLGQSALLFFCGKVLFGLSFSNGVLLVIPVVICTSLTATSLGLLLATLVKTDSQVSAYTTFLVITMAGLSGCFLPRQWLPEIMQQISLTMPHAWSLIAYDQIFSQPQADYGVIFGCCTCLLAFTAVFFGTGCRRFQSDNG